MHALTDTTLKFIGVWIVVLIFFGLPYATIIALRPFRHWLTWLSVFVGDFVTDLGTGAQILLLTGDPILACLPLLNHILTGGPMIMGQIIKHAIQNGGVVEIAGEDGDST